ncbi:MAG: hypothetical protein J07HN4v3_00537 [Halonotius sp. J07HN4]|nr:MAG: hypothetical protein J07HN4v3_00537 [Halonotius sp. J07HN4]
MTSITRRKLLGGCAVGLTAGLAGCGGDAAMFVTAVDTPRTIGQQATESPTKDRPDSETAALVAEAINNGTNRTHRSTAPYQPDRPVVYNETVYELGWSEADRDTSRTEYKITMTTYDDDRETGVSFEELPAVDRERLERYPELTQNYAENPEAEFPKQLVYRIYYPPAERGQSAIVPDPQYDTLSVAGQPAEIAVEPTTVSLDVYQYTATERAPSVEAFGREIRRNHRFELSGLSEAERKLFDRVRSDGSFYMGAFDDVPDGAFEGLADQFVSHPAIIVEDSTGEWLTRYEGTDYWVEFDFILLEEYESRLERVESV